MYFYNQKNALFLSLIVLFFLSACSGSSSEDVPDAEVVIIDPEQEAEVSDPGLEITEPEFDSNPGLIEPETESELEPETETEPESEPETETEPESEPETETEPELEPEPEPESEPETETEPEPEPVEPSLELPTVRVSLTVVGGNRIDGGIVVTRDDCSADSVFVRDGTTSDLDPCTVTSEGVVEVHGNKQAFVAFVNDDASHVEIGDTSYILSIDRDSSLLANCTLFDQHSVFYESASGDPSVDAFCPLILRTEKVEDLEDPVDDPVDPVSQLVVLRSYNTDGAETDQFFLGEEMTVEAHDGMTGDLITDRALCVVFRVQKDGVFEHVTSKLFERGVARLTSPEVGRGSLHHFDAKKVEGDGGMYYTCGDGNDGGTMLPEILIINTSAPEEPEVPQEPEEPQDPILTEEGLVMTRFTVQLLDSDGVHNGVGSVDSITYTVTQDGCDVPMITNAPMSTESTVADFVSAPPCSDGEIGVTMHYADGGIFSLESLNQFVQEGFVYQALQSIDGGNCAGGVPSVTDGYDGEAATHATCLYVYELVRVE